MVARAETAAVKQIARTTRHAYRHQHHDRVLKTRHLTHQTDQPAAELPKHKAKGSSLPIDATNF